MPVFQFPQAHCGSWQKEWNHTIRDSPQQQMWPFISILQLGQTEQMSPRTKVEECRHQKTQTQRSNSPDQPQGVIWGDLKTLNTRAEQYAQQLRVKDTPKNRFLVYLSAVSSNLTKVSLILGLLTCLGGLGLASETNHIYWSHVIDHLCLSSILGGILSLLSLVMILSGPKAPGSLQMDR